MHELRVVGVRVELPANQPVVLLKEAEGERYMPIWIGAVEAAAIAFEQQGVHPTRPMTHDLLRDVISALGGTLEAVHITELKDGLYLADMVFTGQTTVNARPSDAIAVALRVGTPIYAASSVLDEVGITIPDDEAEGDPPRSAGQDEVEVERFREFLDQISPDDFAGGKA